MLLTRLCRAAGSYGWLPARCDQLGSRLSLPILGIMQLLRRLLPAPSPAEATEGLLTAALGDKCAASEDGWDKAVDEMWCSGARFRAKYRRHITYGGGGPAATALTRHQAGMKTMGQHHGAGRLGRLGRCKQHAEMHGRNWAASRWEGWLE